MDTLNDLNERVDAFVGTSSFDTPAAANDQAPIDVPAEVHEDIVASVDFSEVELADEITEPQVAVTPNGLLPMEPLPIDGRLRKAALRMPDEIEEASGFTLFGRRIKSLIYTTDVAVIRNSNADAVFAVYPFTPQPAIRSIRPAACPFSFARSGAPRAALAACPEDRIVRQPRETASSSARNGSRVMSNARWSVTSICPAQAIMRRICARSSSPSGVSAPMTTPFAPRSRKAAISSHISSSSGSV